MAGSEEKKMKIEGKPTVKQIVFGMFFTGICVFFLFGLFFITPEKEIAWKIHQESNGALSYQEAKQAEITLVEDRKWKRIYQSELNGEKELWIYSTIGFSGSMWSLEKYDQELQFQDAVQALSRQDMVFECITKDMTENLEARTELAIWKEYAVLSDDAVRERYRDYFFKKGDSE